MPSINKVKDSNVYVIVRSKLLSSTIALISSYLQDKSFPVSHQQYYSSPKNALSGIQQGSGLDFILFNLFIKDILLPTSYLLKLTSKPTILHFLAPTKTCPLSKSTSNSTFFFAW